VGNQKVATQDTIGENAGSQAAASMQPGFGAGSERAIHPMARAAFAGTPESDALDCKLLGNERIEVHAARDDVPACGARLGLGKVQLCPKHLEHFHGKERNLALVVLLEPKETVSSDALSGDAFDLVHLEDGMFTCSVAMMAKVIVAWRNEQMFDPDHDRVVSDFPGQNPFKDVTVAMRFILAAMAHQGYGLVFRQLLKPAQGKFLSMVLDGLVAAINGAAFVQFLPVAPPELKPSNLAGLGGPEECFAGSEICHPDVIPRGWHATPTKTGRKNSQATFGGLGWTEDGLCLDHRSDGEKLGQSGIEEVGGGGLGDAEPGFQFVAPAHQLAHHPRTWPAGLQRSFCSRLAP